MCYSTACLVLYMSISQPSYTYCTIHNLLAYLSRKSNHEQKKGFRHPHREIFILAVGWNLLIGKTGRNSPYRFN